MADLGNQLKIQQEINKTLQDREKILKNQTKYLDSQARIAMELCKALKCEQLDQMEERLNNVQAGLQKAASDAEQFGSKTTAAMNDAEEAAGGFLDKVTAAKGAAVGLGVGLLSGFKGGLGLISAMGKGLISMATSMGKLAATVIMTPWKIFSGLLGMAQSGSGDSPIRKALEDIRGELGSLASNEGKAAADSMKTLRSEASSLGGTGLSLARVFGFGPEGVAAAMKYNQEMVTALGAAYNGLMGDLKGQEGVLMTYRMALGMTAEQQATMLKMAKNAGKDAVEEQTKFASMAINMGKAFDVNAKVVGKAMATMKGDVANFGSMTRKELGATAVYASKLGMEIKDMMGVIDKYDNFEDAAQGAAQLSQAFGMNVDAMKMMNAQSPAERIDILKKSFHEAGKSVEDMSRQELKLLASQMGLSEEAAKTALSQKNMGLSYDEMMAGAEDAESKQLTQAEATKELADSIKKMTKSGQSDFKGFFDAFAKGFERGIKRSAPFRKMMRNIRKSLRVVTRAGIQVGKMFVNLFPGVKKLMTGISDLFDPARFSKLMTKVKSIFKKFFLDLKSDPKAGVDSFIKNMTKAFTGFFGGGGTAGKKIMEGAKSMGKTLWAVFKVLLVKAAEGLAKLLDMISAKLSKGFSGGGAVMGSIKTALIALAQSLGKLLLTMWTIIKPSLIKMFLILFDKAKPILKKVGAAILSVIIAKMVLTAIANAMIGAVVAKGAQLIGKGLGKMMGSATPSVPGGGGGASALGETLKGGFSGLASGMKAFVETIAQISYKSIVQAGLKMALLALSFLPAMAVMAVGVLMVTAIISKLPIKTVLGAMLAFTLAVVAIAVVAHVGSKIPMGAIGMAMVGLIGAALLMSTAGVVFAMTLRVISKVFKGVPWLDVGLGMLALGVSIAAVAAMAYIALLLNPTVVAGGLMGLGGGVLFTIALVGFAIVMAELAKEEAFKTIVTALPTLIEGFKGLAIIMLLLAITAVAAIVAGVAGVVAVIPLIGVAAFLGGLMAVTLLLSGFELVASTVSNWGKLAMTFTAFATVMGAMAVMAPLAIIAGALGFPAALATFGVALFAKALAKVAVPAFGVMAEAAKQVKWELLAKTFAKLVGIFGAIAIIAPIAIFAGVTAAAAAVAMGGIALFAMAMAIPGGLIWSLGVMTGALKAAKLDWGELGKTFLQLVVIFGAVAILAVIAVAAGVIAAIGAIGILPVAAFIWAMGKFLAPALVSFESNMKGPLGKLGGMMTGLEALGLLFEVFVIIGVASLMLGAVFLNPMIAVVAAVGFAAVLMLAQGLNKFLGPAVEAIADLEMGDAGAFKQKLEAIGPMMEMISGLGSMVTGLGDMGGDADGAAKVLDSAAGFMDSMLGGLEDLITKMTSTTLTPSQIESAMIIAQIMKPIGDLLKAMKPDPEMLKSLRKESLFGSKFDPEALKASQEFMSSMMETMSDGIAKIMLVVKDVAKTLTPAATKQLKTVLPLIADSIKLLGTMSKAFKDVGSIVPAKGDPATRLEATLKFMGGVMDAMVGKGKSGGGHIQKVFDAVKKMAGSLGGVDGSKIKIIGDAMGIVGKFAKVIGDMRKLLPKKAKGTSMARSMDLVFGKGGLIEKITESLAGSTGKPGAMGKVLGAILLMAADIKLDAGMGKKIKIIADAFGIVGSFAGAIGEMAGFMPKAGTIDNPTQHAARVKSATDLITAMSDVIGDAMGTVLKAIIDMIKPKPGVKVSDVYKYRHSLKALPDAFKAMGAFAGALGGIKDIGGGKLDAAAIKTEINSLTGVLADDSVTAGLSAAITAMGKVSKIAAAEKWNIKGMENFGKYIEATVNTVMGVPPGLLEQVHMIADSFAMLEADLQAMNAGDNTAIVAVVDIAKALTGQSTLTVDVKGVNVNLNVNVKMSAEKLAEAIILADVGIATTGNKSAP